MNIEALKESLSKGQPVFYKWLSFYEHKEKIDEVPIYIDNKNQFGDKVPDDIFLFYAVRNNVWASIRLSADMLDDDKFVDTYVLNKLYKQLSKPEAATH